MQWSRSIPGPWCVALGVVVLLSSLPAAVSASAAPLLVETAWLAAHLSDAHLRVVDLRSAPRYRQGHIPRAVHISPAQLVDMEQPVRGQRLSASQLEGLLAPLGISNRTHVVAYDDQGGLYAARFWWVLTSYGHASVSVLNGGWRKWQREKRPVSTEGPHPKPAKFSARPVRRLVATKDEVWQALEAPDVAIVDARSWLEYRGWVRYAARGGHIPGALHLEWKRTLQRDGTLLPLADLRAMVHQKGLRPQQRIITYCQSGVRAAHLAFVLRFLGYPNVAVYDGSWEEWGNDPRTPVE